MTMGLAEKYKPKIHDHWPYIKAFCKKEKLGDAVEIHLCRLAERERPPINAYDRSPRFGKGVWLLAEGELKNELDLIINKKHP